MEIRFNFTKRVLEKIETPSKLTTYHDTHVKGLKLVVHPTGNKVFIHYRKIEGRPERIKIGPFPEITVEQARVKVGELNAQIAKGINPNDKGRTEHVNWTLDEFFDLYIERYAKLHKKTWRVDINRYKFHLKAWGGKRKLSVFKKLDIQGLHIKVGKNSGIYAANRLLALVQVIFNKAIEWGWEHPNPAHGIKKYKEESRDRHLQADELNRFFDAVSKEPNEIIRDYVLISLLTGARRSNVLAIRWSDINFEGATWFIKETKNGTPQTIPLLPAAIEILQARQEQAISEFVFPGTGESGHLAEPKKGWKRILAWAGIEGLRIHDLRRSLGSWQASTGASLPVIGKTLNHKDIRSTSIYARVDLDPVRNAMDKAVNAMFSAGGIENISELAKTHKTHDDEDRPGQ